MNVLFERNSQNNRYGVAVVGNIEHSKGNGDYPFPARGSLKAIGVVGGVSTYEFIKDDSANTWVDCLPYQVKAHGGVSVAYTSELQGGKWASVVLLKDKAVFEKIGYKGRSREVKLFVNGVETHTPQAVLAALGLVPVAPLPAVEEPEEVNGALKEALLEFYKR